MTSQGWFQIAIFVATITVLVNPLGGYIARVMAGTSVLQRKMSRIENGLYHIAGVNPFEEQTWMEYAIALVWFNLIGMVVLYGLQRLQSVLPFNPQRMPTVSPALALNTAVSFATNTSWQSYGGETTLGYLVQMAGITVQSFLSGACGIAVAIALVRGFARNSTHTIGNFWVDLTRAVFYILLPICVPDLGGRTAKPGPLHHHDHAGRPSATAGPWTGGIARSNQIAERGWWRLFQCEFGTSFREPYSLQQPDRDVADLSDRRGAYEHIRPHGG